MNWKKFFFAFIAAFVFLFVFGFLWYANLMHSAHREVATLLRSEAELNDHFAWLIFGHIVMAFFLTLLCVRFVPGGGAGAGATLGILVGLVYGGATFDLIRSSTVDDENPLRLDRGCRDPIRDCWRNHRRHLQTGFADQRYNQPVRQDAGAAGPINYCL